MIDERNVRGSHKGVLSLQR